MVKNIVFPSFSLVVKHRPYTPHRLQIRERPRFESWKEDTSWGLDLGASSISPQAYTAYNLKIFS